jgi:hypothetical protein
LSLICTPKLSSSDLDNSTLNRFKVSLKSVEGATGAADVSLSMETWLGNFGGLGRIFCLAEA